MGGFEKMSGTSMAAPHVSGMAAILYQKQKESGEKFSASEVKRILLEGAERVSGVQNKVASGVASFTNIDL